MLKNVHETSVLSVDTSDKDEKANCMNSIVLPHNLTIFIFSKLTLRCSLSRFIRVRHSDIILLSESFIIKFEEMENHFQLSAAEPRIYFLSFVNMHLIRSKIKISFYHPIYRCCYCSLHPVKWLKL